MKTEPTPSSQLAALTAPSLPAENKHIGLDIVFGSHLPVLVSTPHVSNNTKQLEYLYLLERGGRQFVDDCLGLSSEHLLSRGVADRASSVGNDVVGVPHSGVHVTRTLGQCLGRDLLNLSVRRKG